MIEQYWHEFHNCEVYENVQDFLKGKHREHCLCFQNCRYCEPGESSNCPRARELFEFCVKWDMFTPVYECPEYKEAK
jgi:hypothetical protein